MVVEVVRTAEEVAAAEVVMGVVVEVVMLVGLLESMVEVMEVEVVKEAVVGMVGV